MAASLDIGQLVRDHSRLNEYTHLLESLPTHVEQAKKWAGVEKIEAFFCKSLKIHFAMEEKHVYPAVLAHAPKSEPTRHAIETLKKEHSELRGLIGRMEEIIYNQPFPLIEEHQSLLNSIIAALIPMLKAHASTEDTKIFPLLANKPGRSSRE